MSSKNNSHMKKRVTFTQQSFFETSSPKDLVMKNAWDHTHLEHTHSSSIKTCRVVQDFGNVVIIYLQVNSVWWLPFSVQSFILVKSRSEHGKYQFLSFPVKQSIAKTVVEAVSTPEGGTKLTHNFQISLPWYLAWFGKFVLYIRARGERQRFKEDSELIRLTEEAIKRGHKENKKCLVKDPLLEEWFSG